MLLEKPCGHRPRQAEQVAGAQPGSLVPGQVVGFQPLVLLVEGSGAGWLNLVFGLVIGMRIERILFSVEICALTRLGISVNRAP